MVDRWIRRESCTAIWISEASWMKNYPNIFWNRIHEEQESIFRSIKLKSNLNIVLQVSISTDQTYILNMTQISQHRFKIINFPCTKLTTTPAKRIQRSTQCFSNINFTALLDPFLQRSKEKPSSQFKHRRLIYPPRK